jgi:hypothetical protein
MDTRISSSISHAKNYIFISQLFYNVDVSSPNQPLHYFFVSNAKKTHFYLTILMLQSQPILESVFVKIIKVSCDSVLCDKYIWYISFLYFKQ